MRWRHFDRLTLWMLFAVGFSALATNELHAQISGVAGVVVDADHVLQVKTFNDPTGQLQRQRIAAARAQLDPKVAAASKLRKVSLNRLEAELKVRLANGSAPTDDMLNVAGLTRVQYVFYYPETKDIVIAGPAEGWSADLSGRMRGIESGRPVIELQDLIVALRTFAPGQRKAPVLLVSIDPTTEGLARMQDFLRKWGSGATPNDTQRIVDGLRTSLGMQNIRVGGIAANTHFAQVLIEADYRMKLIGIGLERPPIRLASYVEKANPAQVSRNALQRWYFVPDYQCVRVTSDERGMELVGDGVKLIGEDEFVSKDGNRQVAGRTDKASQLFVTGFTQKYSALAAQVPVYAQLRNLIDLSVAAAFIQQHDYYGKAGWTMETFGSEAAYKVETYTTPVHVDTVVASVWKGNHLMTPVGGGVRIEPRNALAESNLLSDDEGKVATAQKEIDLKHLAAGQWWWD